MDERLRPFEKLRRSAEFRRVFERGRCFHTPCVRIHYLVNEQPWSRLGLVVTRRMGKAVIRNRIRRRLREVYRRNKHGLPHAMDVIFIAKNGPQELDAYVRAFRSFLEKMCDGSKREGAS